LFYSDILSCQQLIVPLLQRNQSFLLRISGWVDVPAEDKSEWRYHAQFRLRPPARTLQPRSKSTPQRQPSASSLAILPFLVDDWNQKRSPLLLFLLDTPSFIFVAKGCGSSPWFLYVHIRGTLHSTASPNFILHQTRTSCGMLPPPLQFKFYYILDT